tara:strand:- start:23106 stop:23711 length:606 start_codon:yes stop_codon:yes gene_type:complete
MATDPSPLLPGYLSQFKAADAQGTVLDLACGSGRNGLYLLENGIRVVFADNDAAALAQVQSTLRTQRYRDREHLATSWTVDFEQCQANPFDNRRFAAIIVYRYLHRPLFEHIRQAVKPGGLVIYETFTVDQPKFGRPRNPDFLLEHGELPGYFSGWSLLHSFEGVVTAGPDDTPQAVAQVVARRPSSKPIVGPTGSPGCAI